MFIGRCVVRFAANYMFFGEVADDLLSRSFRKGNALLDRIIADEFRRITKGAHR